MPACFLVFFIFHYFAPLLFYFSLLSLVLFPFSIVYTLLYFLHQWFTPLPFLLHCLCPPLWLLPFYFLEGSLVFHPSALPFASPSSLTLIYFSSLAAIFNCNQHPPTLLSFLLYSFYPSLAPLPSSSCSCVVPPFTIPRFFSLHPVSFHLIKLFSSSSSLFPPSSISQAHHLHQPHPPSLSVHPPAFSLA